MQCQNCNQREANVHITKIVNGVKTEMHLCDECAKQMQDTSLGGQFGFGLPLSFQNFVDGLFEVMGGAPQHHAETVRCQVCGMTFEDFRNNGRVGCGNCYTVFSNNMVPLIRRVHGNIQHTGKVPKRAGGVLKLKRNIEHLKEELKMAVEKEEYEKAAKLRDEIRELENEVGNVGK